jgi:hypothetical protein
MAHIIKKISAAQNTYIDVIIKKKNKLFKKRILIATYVRLKKCDTLSSFSVQLVMLYKEMFLKF